MRSQAGVAAFLHNRLRRGTEGVACVSSLPLCAGCCFAPHSLQSGVGSVGRPSSQARPAVQSLGTSPIRDESQVKLKRNAWTVGLAAGLPEGAPLRFAPSSSPAFLTTATTVRVIPMVPRPVRERR